MSFELARSTEQRGGPRRDLTIGTASSQTVLIAKRYIFRIQAAKSPLLVVTLFLELHGAGAILMATAGNNRLAELERRELQLTVFACFAIAVLAVGTAVLMYPVVFPAQGTVDTTMRVAFFGFCGLCLLLAWYVFE